MTQASGAIFASNTSPGGLRVFKVRVGENCFGHAPRHGSGAQLSRAPLHFRAARGYPRFVPPCFEAGKEGLN